MKITINKILIILLIIFNHTQGQTLDQINWPKYMAQHDLVWEDIPNQWAEGAFVGNGQLGMMLYAKLDENRFNFHVGRQDVTDHRKAPHKKTSLGVDGTNLMDFSRLDIGKMALHPVGQIKTANIRQDLWNAEIRGTIITDLGEIKFRAFTPYDKMVQVIEATSTEMKNGAYVPFSWKWMPGKASSPRAYTKYEQYKDTYKFNPHEPEIIKEGNEVVCVQKLEAGGDYATAWTDIKSKNGQKSTLYIATANEVPAANVSAKVALKNIREAKSIGVGVLEKNHKIWWHRYFKKSFLNIPDTRMESFYWIQLYKMAACSRTDGPALDLMGPFFKNTGWPGLWWNLNVQLTYWPFNTSNHQNIATNYIRLIDDYFEWIMRKKTGKSLGDYAWALHNYWLYFNYQGNKNAILEKWVPKAMRIADVYEKKLVRNKDGVLELTPMGSPEYMGFKAFKNTNYNLGLLRWLLTELIKINKEEHQNVEKVKHWQEVLADLIPYPVDENGLMIGSDQPVDISHRHYSHLLALYPLFQLNPDDPKDRDLVVKSVLHWHNIDDGKALAGYSFTGASSLYAAMGMGDEAVAVMQDFLSANIGRAHFLPNTFYMEGNSPVIETPLSAAASIMEYNLQSWGNKIRVFPAIPSDWKDASFVNLLAQGGFLISASLKDKKIEWVAIESKAGEPCILKVPGWSKAKQIGDGRKVKIKKIAVGEFSIDLKKGEKIIVSSNKDIDIPILNVIEHSDNEKNYFGVKKGAPRKPLLEYPILEYKK